MKNQFFSLILLAIFVCLSATSTYGFDHKRKGFILGLGAGVNSTDIDSNTTNYGGMATSFKIGGGFNEQFLLFYTRDVAWLNLSSTTFANGITGLGFQYYFKPTTNSFYISGGVGAGDFYAPNESNAPTYTGSAYTLGLGYEFHRHVSIEGKLLTTKLKEKDFDFDLDSTSILLTVNYLWY